MPIQYFAYGSNMLPARLMARCPSASFVGLGRAIGFGLAFTKPSKDGSGKATLVARTGSCVQGAIFSIEEAERGDLDRHEGVGGGYRRLDDFSVQNLVTGAQEKVTTYIADLVDPGQKPFDWYLALVIAGAVHHGLDEAALISLRAETYIADPKDERHTRVAAIEAMRAHGIGDYRTLLHPSAD